MRDVTPDFSHLVVYAYVFGIVAIIVVIWSIISMIKSKNKVGGKILSIILSGCIVAICAYILSIDKTLKAHEQKTEIASKYDSGFTYQSNAQIYKDDISSNSRLLITCSEKITEKVQIWSAYRYNKHEYIDDEEDFSIHVLLPTNSTNEKGNKSRMFKIQLAEDGFYYTVEPYEIIVESEDSDAIQVGYFFRISDFYKICGSYLVSAEFESPVKFGECIKLNEDNVDILRKQVELIQKRLEQR